MMTPAEQYKYDAKFRQIVDILRNELMRYEFTPSELRQAVILAATMHADQNIKPIIYMDEAKLFTPAMFGGLDLQGCTSGRFQSSKPNFTEVNKVVNQRNPKSVADRRDPNRRWTDNPRGKWERYQGGYAELKRNPNTGDRRKHVHFFTHVLNRDYSVCSCGISNVYFNSTLENKTATGSNL
jgi:hypothetical protein